MSCARQMLIAVIGVVGLIVVCEAHPHEANVQGVSEDDRQILQGDWTVAAAEQRGRPFDVIVGGTLTIAGNRFDLLTAAGNAFQGTIRLDASATPRQLDFVHDDGVVWKAIYVATQDFLRLNYVDAADGQTARPTMFVTTSETPGTVIVLRR